MKSFAFIPWLGSLAIAYPAERILTHEPHGHLIHNTGIFSPDGQRIVFDARNDETQLARSTWIGTADIRTGREAVLYQIPAPAPGGPGVGAASFSPVADTVVFLKGLDNASESLPYAPQRRSGFLVDLAAPGQARHLDARDVTPPFTQGALRGGTHAHQWSGDGKWLSFTYNDAVIRTAGAAPSDLRTVGVTFCGKPVSVSRPVDAEDFSGDGFSVVIAAVTAHPAPGSGEISRAYDEGWVGTHGYRKEDGSRQERSIAFIGDIVALTGKPNSEVFIADLPTDITAPGAAGPLEGTRDQLPSPPAGIVIRRLTHTELTSAPGLQGPRHWIRSSPDGGTVAYLDQDSDGIVQIFGISPNGGEPRQISKFSESVDTPFSWSPDGKHLACSSGGRVALVPAAGGPGVFLTDKSAPGCQPLHGTVFSPDGKTLAFNRLLPHPDGGQYLQICIADVPSN